jgi:GMP synthase (glutamine-hydrolysing)
MEFNPIPKSLAKLLESFPVGMYNPKQDWAMAKFVDKELERTSAFGWRKRGEFLELIVVEWVRPLLLSSYSKLLVTDFMLPSSTAVLCVPTGVSRSKRLLQNTWALISLFLMLLSYFLKSSKGLPIIRSKNGNSSVTFHRVFEAEAKKIEDAADSYPEAGKVEWLLEGTLRPDIIKSISFKGSSATIKTHHNVDGLLERMVKDQGLKLIASTETLQGRSPGIRQEIGHTA